MASEAAKKIYRQRGASIEWVNAQAAQPGLAKIGGAWQAKGEEYFAVVCVGAQSMGGVSFGQAGSHGGGGLSWGFEPTKGNGGWILNGAGNQNHLRVLKIEKGVGFLESLFLVSECLFPRRIAIFSQPLRGRAGVGVKRFIQSRQSGGQSLKKGLLR